MVDYADIGKRIRACRLAKGMTQEQLANEVGAVVTHISHIETGNSVPSLKNRSEKCMGNHLRIGMTKISKG